MTEFCSYCGHTHGSGCQTMKVWYGSCSGDTAGPKVNWGILEAALKQVGEGNILKINDPTFAEEMWKLSQKKDKTDSDVRSVSHVDETGV